MEKTRLQLGHQKISSGAIEAMVNRLSTPKKYSDNSTKKKRSSDKRDAGLTKEQTDAMLERIANKDSNRTKTPDTRRVCQYTKVWGTALNSYAWNGLNHQAILCGEDSP
ncbi:Hypothetical predicted protein [Paramuricea clavata]|uniref:Uncharacterized protein n=1 Tax=Paramuricea clavata TaxID=317549 RepID=A0A7D9HCT8_PARCT|nr:Hypothetical predicted protein [Paramuricea clavata]